VSLTFRSVYETFIFRNGNPAAVFVPKLSPYVLIKKSFEVVVCHLQFKKIIILEKLATYLENDIF